MAKRWLINLGLLIFSTLLTLVVLELVLRLTPLSSDIGSPNLPPQYYFKYDHELGYDIQDNFPKTPVVVDYHYKYQLWSNELGCFDIPFTPEGDFILILGDSYTHGLISYEDNWCTVLKKYLGYYVLKCGVNGFGTKAELIKARKVISRVRTPPKLIVVGYFLNDLEDDYLFPASTVIDGWLVPKKEFDRENGIIKIIDDADLKKKVEKKDSFRERLRLWLNQSSLLYKRYHMIRRSYFKEPRLTIPAGFYKEDEFPWLKQAWTEHLENLRAFKNLAEEYRAKLLVVIIPSKEQVYRFLLKPKLIDKIFLEQQNNIVKEFLGKEGIPSLDLLLLFREYANEKPRRWLDPENDLYWRHDPHWNVKGNLLAGLLTAEYLLENDLIGIQNKNDKLMIVREKLKKLKSEK